MKKENSNYNQGRAQHEGSERNNTPERGSERGVVSSGARENQQGTRPHNQAGHKEHGGDKCPTCKNVRKGQDVR